MDSTTRLFLGIRWGSWERKIRRPRASRYTINLGSLLRINRGSSRSVLDLIDGAFGRKGVIKLGSFRRGV